MNYDKNKNLIYFCIENTSTKNKYYENEEISKIIGNANYHISMECIDCLKENDSILGIYNVAHYVKINNG